MNGKAHAPEIEITPAMLIAGVDALCASQDEIAHRPAPILTSTVVAVYLAMARAGRGKRAVAQQRKTRER